MMGRNTLAKRLFVVLLGILMIVSAVFIWWRGSRGEQPQQPQARAAATIEAIVQASVQVPSSTPTPTQSLPPLSTIPVEPMATATAEPSGGLRALIGQNQDSPFQPDPPTRVPPSPARQQAEEPGGGPAGKVGEVLKKGQEAINQAQQALAPPTPTPTPQPPGILWTPVGRGLPTWLKWIFGGFILLIALFALGAITGFVGIERV